MQNFCHEDSKTLKFGFYTTSEASSLSAFVADTRLKQIP
jgi:hypothetical protein